MVSFNLENIQYISRPTSRVFHNTTPTEEKSVEHKWLKAAKRNSFQPDLVRDVGGAFAKDDQNVEKIYEGNRESLFRNKRFMLDEMFQQNASKFVIFLE